MQQKRTAENYLKAIYRLARPEGVHNAEIAQELGVSRPSVTSALRALAQDGYVCSGVGKRVCLTEAGLQVAQALQERHRILQAMLMRFGVAEETAAKDACELEHLLSDESCAAIRTMLAALENA